MMPWIRDVERRARGALIVFLLLLTPGRADDLIWMVADEAPITYEADGKLKGYGINILDRITDAMPSHTHRVTLAGNYARITKQVELGPNTCAMGLFKTADRQKVMHFSRYPVFFFFNIQLVMHRDRFAALGEPVRLQMGDLLTREGVRIGLSKGRTYFQTLRQLLDQNSRADVTYVSQGNVSASLMKMVALKRIDFSLAYPEEAQYLARTQGLAGQVVTVPISDVELLGYSWIACTRNAAGKRSIEQINAILADIRPQDSYRAEFEAWIGPNLLQVFRDEYRTSFLAIDAGETPKTD